MYAFFYTLISALFNGEWVNRNFQYAISAFGYGMARLSAFLINTFGGNFDQAIDSFDWNAQAGSITYYVNDYIYAFVAFILTLGVVFAVWGIIKKIFAIFFSGVR